MQTMNLDTVSQFHELLCHVCHGCLCFRANCPLLLLLLYFLGWWRHVSPLFEVMFIRDLRCLTGWSDIFLSPVLQSFFSSFTSPPSVSAVSDHTFCGWSRTTSWVYVKIYLDDVIFIKWSDDVLIVLWFDVLMIDNCFVFYQSDRGMNLSQCLIQIV